MRTLRPLTLSCLLLVPLLAYMEPACLGPGQDGWAAVWPVEPCRLDPETLFSPEEMSSWKSEHAWKRGFHLFRVASVVLFYLLFFALGVNGRLRLLAERWAARLYEHPALRRAGMRWPLLRRFARAPEHLFGGREWLVVLLYALGFVLLFRLVFFPYAFYRSYWYELQTGLSNYTLGLWLLDYGKALVLATLRYALMVFGIYGLMARVGSRWWLLVWAGVSVAIFGWVYLVPYRQMVYQSFTPLPPGELRSRLESLVRDQGLTLEEIFVVDAGRRTKRVNAYVTGKGASRRIVLFDTLVKSFTPREITVIMAHELAHWAEPEKGRQYLVFSGTVFVVLFLAHLALVWGSRVRFFRVRSPSDVAGLPLMLLTFFVLFMLIRPANLWIRRAQEFEADRASLEMVCDPEAFIRAHTKLARLNRSEIEPHPLVVFLFYSHPPVLERLALAACADACANREDSPQQVQAP